MCGVMQTIIDKERASDEIARSKCIACNIWNNGEHDLNKIAETTLLSVELVREAILMKEYVLTGEGNGTYDSPNLQEVLTKAEDDVKNRRVAPISETFDDLRAMLQEG